MNAYAEPRPAWCFCGASTITRPCTLHGGDLQQRVERLMASIAVIDEVDDGLLSGARKWLAFRLGGAYWHLLPTASAYLRRRRDVLPLDADARLVGDLVVSVTHETWDARQAISQDEALLIDNEAIMSRWPWAGGS